MSLNFRTSIVLIILFSSFAVSQNDSISDQKKLKWLYDDSRQQMGSVALSLQLPTPTGNNFVGQAFEGDAGYNFRTRLFLYQQFYVGYAFGTSNFDVIDRSVVGNYGSSRVRERYFYLGYEFLPLKNLRLGIHSSISGKATFDNTIENTSDNKDTGNLWHFGAYVDYEVLRNLSLFVNYSFNRINTNIEAPVAIQSTFETATYNTLSFGIKFGFGDKDMTDVIGIKL